METVVLSPTNIQKLLKPEVYPHAVRDLKLLETHISWVILTGDFAYKIKKPCKFDFVDYSTPERRHDFCLQELAFNRRLAAELYLDVVPLLLDQAGAWRFGDGSQVIADGTRTMEYAVKMKQFPQEAILSQRLAHHTLTAEAIDGFGVELARFHEAIESAPTDIDCVQTHHIRHDALDNIDTLQRSLPPDSDLQPLLASIAVWTEAEFARRKEAFQLRLDHGFVRRCHGDMHLNNLIQLEDRVTAFDCIEFNEEFQWIDVMSDLAFPVMDFAAQGRPDLGSRLLSGYLEAREDWSGIQVLRFYAVYRAMVRAKVTWLDRSKHVSLHLKNGGEQETGPWEGYIRTAHALAFPPPVRLAITFGLSGSGKSTRALNYVSERKAIRLRSDVERYRIADADLKSRYEPESRARVYEYMLETAERLLGLQYSVVVDATFLHEHQRRAFEVLASKLGIPFEIIECTATPAELERRIEERTGDVSEATLGVLHRQLIEVEPLTVSERRLVVAT